MYTIKQISEITKLTPHTLRYYEKEGLLPNLSRTSSNIRQYTSKDLCWLELVCCLKNSGMPLSKIKEFMNLCIAGDDFIENRKVLLENHKKYIESQICELNNNLCIIEHKIANYKDIGTFFNPQP